MKTNIDLAIRDFSYFLNKSFKTVQPLLNEHKYAVDESIIDDWLQFNWEMLVERNVLDINECLEIYGEGADYFGTSSRITLKDSLPTFSIKVEPQNSILDYFSDKIETIENGIFIKLISSKNDFQNFNYALIDNNNKQMIVSLKDIEFTLIKF